MRNKLYTALNNCAFVSTEIKDNGSKSDPFTFLMDSSMLGVGVGFDTKGSNSIKVYKPHRDDKELYEIPDTREGWVESVKLLLNSYFEPGKKTIEFSYAKIRPKGIALSTFGGVSSGPEPLIDLHNIIKKKLESIKEGDYLKMRDIVDIMNFIGKGVVSGNIRRSAEIAMGEYNDKEFIELKNYEKNPDRMDYGWVSNNSILAKLGMNYQYAVDHILKNGEPGFAWIENMRDYSRMGDPPDYKDKNAAGGNPGLEQTLESYEMGTLVETFPDHHSSYLEFQDTLELAYLYAKTVTLGLTNCDLSNEVMTRNRRIGGSMSGIAQFISNRGVNHLKNWGNRGYDFLRKYDDFISNQFNVSKSIKMTSIKPSGTVSLLAGATPGLHFPESQFYIRRVRLSKENEMIPILERAGYKIEEDVYTPNTYCVEVPVSLGSKIRTLGNVSMWEQLSLAAFLQKYWADNQVSGTVTFDPKTESDSLKPALEYFQYQLKGISFLPKASNSYAQMPYEKITKEEYQKLSQKVSKIELSKELVKNSVSLSDSKPENYGDSSSCSV